MSNNTNDDHVSQIRAIFDSWKSTLNLAKKAILHLDFIGQVESDKLNQLNESIKKYFTLLNGLEQKLSKTSASLKEDQRRLFNGSILLSLIGRDSLIMYLDTFYKNILKIQGSSIEDELREYQKHFKKIGEIFDGYVSDIDEVILSYSVSELTLTSEPSTNNQIAPTNNQVALPAVIDYEIFAVTDSDVIACFDEYQQVANYTPDQSPEFTEISEGIKKIVKDYYDSKIDPGSAKIQAFASIVGPSFMGKTQFAFSLARVFKVFYVNFSKKEDSQAVYKAFESISDCFINTLRSDCDVLKAKDISLDSDELARGGLFVELKTVGFLWYLIEYSLNYDPSKSEWFNYYLEERKFPLKPMSIHQYLQKLKYLVSIKKDFVPPIVFIDEYISKESGQIKLLRNISRIVALPSVLASTNAKVINLLNVNKDTSSRAVTSKTWVHTIRKLPSANLKAILKLLNWNDYADENDDILVQSLLADLNIAHDDSSREALVNLIAFMKEQSKTCLQGVPLIAYRALKEKLIEQSGKELNVKEIWNYILFSLRMKLLSRKLGAFSEDGPYHSLSIMSNHQIIMENEKDELCDVAPTSDIVLSTINEHFYFFGKSNDPNILSFGYEMVLEADDITKLVTGRKLTLNGHVYLVCSHFKLFRENAMLCMSLWTDINNSKNHERPFYRSVASTACHYIFNRSGNASKNNQALKNDSATQECVVHWSLCYSTMQNVSELNQGVYFLEKFINHIQLDKVTAGMVKNNSIRPNQRIKELGQPFKFGSSCPKLLNFLSDIKIPYLIPPNNLTMGIKTKLKGICEFGICSRLANGRGIDIEFDLIHRNLMKKGYVECKYTDHHLDKETVLKYMVRSKDSPLSMIASFTLQKCLKSADLWSSKDVEIKDDKLDVEPPIDIKKAKLELSPEEYAKIEKEKKKIAKLTKIEKQQIIDGFSVYSVFYIDDHLEIVPLVERANPNGVFLIVQTGFAVPKWNKS